MTADANNLGEDKQTELTLNMEVASENRKISMNSSIQRYRKHTLEIDMHVSQEIKKQA